MLEQSAERLSFNVVRCRYAEMYRTLGMADLGSSLSCQRDFALARGIQPGHRAHADPDPDGRGAASATSGSGGGSLNKARTRRARREGVE